MIKKLIFLPLLFVAVLSLGQTLSVGPRIGYASCGMSRQDDNKKPINGILAGGVVNFSFNELFSLQLEAYYYKKGGGYEFTYGGIEYSDYLVFKSVDFPLLAKFTVGKTKAKVIFLGGPYLGYTLGGNWIYKDDVENTNKELDNFTFYDSDGMKTNRWDIGFQLGFGTSIEIGTGKLQMELRYGAGFKEWFKFNTSQNYGLNNLNHRSFAVSVGYLLPIWSK